MTTEFQTARQKVLQDGWNTTCYQILNPGIRRWHSSNSVVGYVEHSGRRIVAGAPVCDKSDLDQALREFEAGAKRKVCYFGAEERLYRCSSDRKGYSCTVLGAQPVWSPASWRRAVERDASLRAQLNRAQNKGVRVVEWDAEAATNHATLRSILASWLKTRGLPELHFLVEPDTLGFLEDRRVFVAMQGQVPVGFATLCPIPTRNGWLTEQFVRCPQAPNGTVELMVDTAVRQVGGEGADMVTMGMVPLSRKAAASQTDPGWLRFTMNWVRAHGRRFYNFDGLEWFKNKFHPDSWDPIYAISTESVVTPRTLYAIASAFTRTSPVLALGQGALRALRQEAQWLMLRRNSLERHR